MSNDYMHEIKNIYKNEAFQTTIKKFDDEIRLLEKAKNNLTARPSQLHKRQKEAVSNLKVMSRMFNETALRDLKSEGEAIARKRVDVGYSKRSEDAKEFEMMYALASDRELQDMTQDIDTDDLLQANLLRMELKKRGMEDQNENVRLYVMKNNLDGSQTKNAEINRNAQIYAGVDQIGAGAFYKNGEYVNIESMEAKLNKDFPQSKY